MKRIRRADKATLERLKQQLSLERSALAKVGVGAGILVLTLLLLDPSLYITPPLLRVGDIAPRNIRARSEFLVEYEDATNRRMEEVQHSVRPVYDFDPSVMSQTLERLDWAFGIMRGELPPLESQAREGTTGLAQSQALPERDQPYTRAAEEPDLAALLGITLSRDAATSLKKAGHSPEVHHYAKEAVRVVMLRGIASSPELLEEAQSKGIVVRNLSTGKERIVADVGSIYDLPSARVALANWVWTAMVGQGYYLQQAIVELGEALVQPNLTFNKRETEVRKQAGLAAVKPFYFQVKHGEMIVRQGERIDEETLLKLNGMNYFSRKTSFRLGMGSLLFVGLVLALAWAYIARFKHRLRHDLRLLILLATLFVGNLAVVRVITFNAQAIAAHESLISPETLLYAVPVALGALLISMFFEFDVTLLFTAATLCLQVLLMKDGLPYALVGLAGGFVAACQVGRYQRRSSIIRVGLLIGAVNAPVIVSLNMIFEALPPTVMAFNAAAGFVGGITAAVAASGLLPLIESLFGATSDIKFLELSDLNNPLLRELCVRAPGTYHHSVIVGNLAEEAAEAIGANALLARVSAYYHDIGKLFKPEYFIENQYGSVNKHDALTPTMSSLVVIAHVKEGLELARRYNLGKPIQDVIEQHHGTSLLSYFYTRAKEKDLLAEQTLDKEDFRYPGPRPQTREAAIVMLADEVEAACRTLTDPTPARIQSLARRIANNVLSDGQLDECDLTLRGLKKIVDSFTRILLGIFHHRIDYPSLESKASAHAASRGRHGGPDKRRADAGADRQAEAAKVAREGTDKDGMQGLRAERPTRR